MRCYAEGTLRAYLDDALPATESAAVGAHLSGCAACQARLAQLRALAAHVGGLLAAPADMPDPRPALAQLRATIDPSTLDQPDTTLRPALRGLPASPAP